MEQMQARFPKDKQEVNAFRKMISESRFAKYLAAANDDEELALQFYIWNNKLSQAFYLPLQIWEICLRNQLNRFLCWKFNGKWPYDDRALRQLKSKEREKVQQAKDRQHSLREINPAPTGAIAADLSAGFWVSLLGKGYEVPYIWRNNLTRVFPHAPQDWRNGAKFGWEACHARDICDRVLNLRNRVAHHEAIYDLDLTGLHDDLGQAIQTMCSASKAYMDEHCTVQEVLQARP